MSNTYIPFLGGNGGAGSGGSGGPGPSHGSGQNNNQSTGSGTTNPEQQSMLPKRREHVDINQYRTQLHSNRLITVVPTIRIPRRLVLTASCYNNGGGSNAASAFIVDVLLVPLSVNTETCFNLYHPLDPGWGANLSPRSPRDNIILLQRMAVRGMHMACAVKELDIAEDIRNRTDYRLVVTCPTLGTSSFTLLLQLEMEF
ncbi:hypothetical protein BC827DRAFT_1219486 [Russula dissimulans]|nr:hypothetical protein BC827DRAFT_1219486 [Russula dissimulans]